ncbi:porin family protein, partial [bacterium]|nr:porin family protein [bacterium]
MLESRNCSGNFLSVKTSKRMRGEKKHMKNLAQYKIVVLQVIAALAFSSGIQAARVNVGLQLGALSPNDALVKDTFSGDFYYQGLLGLKDPDSGFEIRGTLGHYSNLSHHPADVGRGFKLSVTPLTASVLYHFTTGPSVIQPYVGAGVGAFFYDGSEDVSGRLFSGTKWGTQLMLGAKFTVMPSVHVVGEYIKSFVPQLVFDNAANFNHDIFTLGIGFSLAPQNRQFEPPPPPQSPAIQQDSLSAEIDQLTVDLKKMTDTQDKLQAQIDAFYTSDSGDERVGILAAVDSKTALTGSEFTIISPGSSQTLVNGIIETIDSAGPVIQIGLKNDQGWRMSVAITRAPFSV